MAVSSLKSTNWKFHNSQQGTTAVGLPTDWSELLITVSYGWNSTYGSVFYIPKCHGTNSPHRLSSGYCENPTNEYGNTQIIFNYTNNTVAILMNMRNGVDKKADAVMRVYYR